MNIYNYHPDTLEYIGQSNADESPLEKGVFLIAAFATEIEPPEQVEGKMRIFSDNEWKYEDIPKVEEILDIPKVEDERQQILQQLAQLDTIVPRILEDIIEQGSFTIHQSKLDIIAQKQALREQLINI